MAAQTPWSQFNRTYTCSVCHSSARLEERIGDFPYYFCPECNLLFMPSSYRESLYNHSYWNKERLEATRREREDCCLRALELIYLSKIPVNRILDFGCGMGMTVDWLRAKLGLDAYGMDKYGHFSPNQYLLKEDLLAPGSKFEEGFFDAILSVEVVEHLNQEEIIPIFEKLKRLLKPGGILLINTGMLEYVKEREENRSYMDPEERGHISIFAMRTFQYIADRIGLWHIQMWTRNYVALLMRPCEKMIPTISPWGPLQENINVLARSDPLYPLMIRQSLWAEELVLGQNQK